MWCKKLNKTQGHSPGSALVWMWSLSYENLSHALCYCMLCCEKQRQSTETEHAGRTAPLAAEEKLCLSTVSSRNTLLRTPSGLLTYVQTIHGIMQTRAHTVIHLFHIYTQWSCWFGWFNHFLAGPIPAGDWGSSNDVGQNNALLLFPRCAFFPTVLSVHYVYWNVGIPDQAAKSELSLFNRSDARF